MNWTFSVFLLDFLCEQTEADGNIQPAPPQFLSSFLFFLDLCFCLWGQLGLGLAQELILAFSSQWTWFVVRQCLDKHHLHYLPIVVLLVLQSIFSRMTNITSHISLVTWRQRTDKMLADEHQKQRWLFGNISDWGLSGSVWSELHSYLSTRIFHFLSSSSDVFGPSRLRLQFPFVFDSCAASQPGYLKCRNVSYNGCNTDDTQLYPLIIAA